MPVWKLTHLALCLVIFALAAVVPMQAVRAAAQVTQIADCTENGLDRALASAVDGSTLRFVCDGTISVSSTRFITRTLTLDGTGRNVTLDGYGTVQILKVSRGVSLELSGLTIQRGGTVDGGAAIANFGSLTIRRCILKNNIHALANYGLLSVVDSDLADNRGVGVYNQRDLNVSGSTFQGNTHGIDNASGTAVVRRSTFTGNRFTLPTGIGAGVANSGTMTIYDSIFTDNDAVNGGSIGNHLDGTVTLVNTLVVATRAQGNCYGPIIDGGNNLQYPGTTCGSSIRTADPQLFSIPVGTILAFLRS